MDDPIDQLKQEVLRLPNLTQSYASFVDEAMGFYHAVAWAEERWLQAVFALEAVLLVGVFLARRTNYMVQGALLFLLVVLIASSESLNAVGSRNWKAFSTQNYFDKHGVFTGVVFAAPLLCILLVHVVVLIKDAADLVVLVKRKELGVDARLQQQEQHRLEEEERKKKE